MGGLEVVDPPPPDAAEGLPEGVGIGGKPQGLKGLAIKVCKGNVPPLHKRGDGDFEKAPTKVRKPQVVVGNRGRDPPPKEVPMAKPVP